MVGGGLVDKSCPTVCNPMDYIACQAPLSMGFFRHSIYTLHIENVQNIAVSQEPVYVWQSSPVFEDSG